MHALLFALFAAFAGDLPPVPTGDALAAAEADVQEVFGDQLRAARKPAERVDLARQMIDTAGSSKPANKYALLVRARELAIDAGDSATAIAAVEGLARGFAPQKPRGAASWASEGHHLWNLAGHKRPQDRLRAQVEAAECYLRALPELTGISRTAAEGRLRQLGWRAGPIDFNFDEDAEGWVARNDIVGLEPIDGCLVGKVTGNDPYLDRQGLAVAGDRCPVVVIRMAVTPPKRAKFFWATKNSPRWGGGKSVPIAIDPTGRLREYRLDMRSNRLWSGQTIVAIRLDPGDEQFGPAPPTAFAIDYIRGEAVASN